MISYTNLVQWYDTDLQNKRLGRHKQYHLLQKYLELTKLDDANLKLSGAEQGAALSKNINEPFWYVYFACKQVEALDNLDRFKESLDMVVRLVVEIAKEQYSACSYNGFVYFYTIKAYYHNDCIANSQGILDAIDFVEANLPMNKWLHASLIEYQTRVMVALERWEDAKSSAMKYQSLCDVYNFDYYQSALFLAHIAFRLGDLPLLSAQAQTILRTPSRNSYYRFMHNAALYWAAIYSYLSGEHIEKSESWKKKLIGKNEGMDRDDLSFTAVFHYTRLIHYDYAYCMSIISDVEIFSPFEQKQHLLRYYYLLMNAPEGEIVAMDMTNMARKLLDLPQGHDTFMRIGDLIDERKTNVFIVLLTAVSVGLLFLVSYKVICPIRLYLKPPIEAAANRLRALLKAKEEVEFFEERIRWIDEKRDYVP